jgi:hypothetical protein
MLLLIMYCWFVGEVNKSLQKSLLNPVLTTFSEALVAALSIPDSSHASDAGLKTQVTYLCRRVNKSLQKSLLKTVLTTFPEVLEGALSIPNSSHASDAGLKT